MIKYSDLEDLLDLRSPQQPILSVYLNTDRSRYPLDRQRMEVRNLLREGRKAIETGAWNESVRKALMVDLEKVEQFLAEEMTPDLSHRGLALFICQEVNLWRTFGLPRPVPTSWKLEYAPYLRPLTLILDEYHRFGVLLLDRKTAEMYEVYIGDILKIEEAFKPSVTAPLQVMAVEHPGSGDRGISTHREEADLQKHFRRLADTSFHLFHRRHYEYLILGGQQSLLAQFENYLHPTLQEKLVGRFSAEPGKTRPAKILEEVAAIERKVETETEKRLILQLVNTAKSRGLAILGLDPVMAALKSGAVHMLFVEDGWHTPGFLCRNCGFLSLSNVTCISCGEDLVPASDIVDDLIESALRTGSIIEHVHPAAGLQDQGHIGAILRFKLPG